MSDDDLPAIPPPLAGDARPGTRLSLCDEALDPILAAIAGRARDAGWADREIAAALIGHGTRLAVASDGPDAAGEALMLALDFARHAEPGIRRAGDDGGE